MLCYYVCKFLKGTRKKNAMNHTSKLYPSGIILTHPLGGCSPSALGFSSPSQMRTDR